MISVIIPIYNVEKYLSRCLDSVINQTYTNLEIIVVNDGSTDSSGAICDEYAKRDSRIIVIHQINKGPSEARNAGLDIAKGEYIGLIDSDDFISSCFFEILYNKLIETNSDISFCGFQKFLNIEEINKDISIFHTKEYKGEDFIRDFVYTKDTVNYVIICNKLYKRYIWENLRYPIDKRVCEDEYIWYKCLYNSKKICEIDVKLYYYFQRENSTTNKNYDKFSFVLEMVFLEALEDRINFCKKNNLDKFSKRTEVYRNKLLRKIYITTPKNKIPDYVKEELRKNIKNISFAKRIKIYLKKYF